MNASRTAVWTALAVGASLMQAAAQPPAMARQRTSYALSGTIADHDGKPVEGAEVTVIEHDSSTRRVRSDTAGRFELRSLVTPTVTLKIRRLGFASRIVDVAINGADRHSTVVIELEPVAAELAGVAVVDAADEPDARLRAYYSRKATNSFGRYIDGTLIETRRPQYLSEMLRSVSGVSISPSSRIGYRVLIRGCPPLVWLDGVRIPGAQLDEIIQPAEVAAMEVYNSFAGIPAQYFDRSATCGTILVWTRAR
ncbi:MAG TPA: carboxypeptidase regulatory-like domain-containing protein [Gemmatimonadaceae bacterium]|nr:carboxypeptidase regulatory-like domain-containing protein [Gemmatimonadaceae bacterium]